MKWTQTETHLFMNKSIPLKNGQHIKVNQLEQLFLLTDLIGTPQVFCGA